MRAGTRESQLLCFVKLARSAWKSVTPYLASVRGLSESACSIAVFNERTHTSWVQWLCSQQSNHHWLGVASGEICEEHSKDGKCLAWGCCASVQDTIDNCESQKFDQVDFSDGGCPNRATMMSMYWSRSWRNSTLQASCWTYDTADLLGESEGCFGTTFDRSTALSCMLI